MDPVDPLEELAAKATAAALLHVVVCHDLSVEESTDLLAAALLLVGGRIDAEEAQRRHEVVTLNAKMRLSEEHAKES